MDPACRPGPSHEDSGAARARIAEALACPCVAGLQASECGPSFIAAFSCFHSSTALPRACDCLQANLAFAACLRDHPEAVGVGGSSGGAGSGGGSASSSGGGGGGGGMGPHSSPGGGDGGGRT